MAGPVPTVFFGSGAFAVPVVEALAAHGSVRLVAVVSAPDRPAGRGRRTRAVPVAALARSHGWPLLQPARLRDAAAVAAVLATKAELSVLADYGRIVPPELVDAPRFGALNVHPSLLPRHRGASPVVAAILAGDTEAGVTIIRMDAGVDTGPIVAQERVTVAGDETAAELEARLADLGARLLEGLLEGWLQGSIVARAQAVAGATVTPVLRREDGRLDWHRDAAMLERQVRAYQPWPGSFSGSPLGRLIVWRAAVRPGGHSDVAAGAVVSTPGGLVVACGSGWLELLEVQPAGRPRMSGRDLLNGHPELVGTRLA